MWVRVPPLVLAFNKGLTAESRESFLRYCPVGNKPAGPHPDPQEINDIAYDTFWDFVKQEAGAFCMAFNVTDWPAVVVRGGTSPDGMPIGVQVVAKPWREDQAIAVAASIEKKLGGGQPPNL